MGNHKNILVFDFWVTNITCENLTINITDMADTDDDDEREAHVEKANTVIGERLVQGTKDQYTKKAEKLKSYLRRYYPHCVDEEEDEVVLPLNEEAAKGFLASVSTSTRRRKDDPVDGLPIERPALCPL